MATRTKPNRPRRRWFQFSLRTLFVLVTLLSVWLALMVSAARKTWEAARESDCRSQLKQMSLALWTYHETYGSLPPAFLNDHHGNPIHSWRMLILPYWDRHDLYSNCDFSVPWNHPANSRVAAYRTNSFFYGCKSGQSRQSGTTNYVAVIGEGTAWPGRTSSKFDDFTDGLATTILVLEVPDNDILWLEPKDITLEQLLAHGLESNHSNHVNVMFADGRVRRIRKDIDATTLRALLTISGGETVNVEKWQATETR